MQYHFGSGITKEDEEKLKTITSGITDKVGIYLCNEPVKIVNTEKLSCYIDEEMFGDNTYIFSTSKEIFNIAEHLEPIIKLVISSHTVVEKFFLAVTEINQDHYKIVVFTTACACEPNYIQDEFGTFILMLANIGVWTYLFDVINNKVASVKSTHAQWNGRCSNSDNSSGETNRRELFCYSPYTLTVSNSGIDLTDRYFSMIASLKKRFDKQITIVNHDTQFTVNLKNCSSTKQIKEYLQMQFGNGKLNFDVDMENNTTAITYTI